MLEFVRDKASARKLRLFEAACCRMVWHLLPEAGSEQGVEAAEDFADGMLGPAAFAAATQAALWAAGRVQNDTESEDSTAQFMATEAASWTAGGNRRADDSVQGW